MAVGWPFLQRDQLASRLKAVAERRQELSAKQKAMLQKSTRFQPRRHVSLMKSVLSRLKLQNMMENKGLKNRLAQAGYRRQSAIITFIFLRIASPMLFSGLALIFVTSNPTYAAKALSVKLMICGGAAAIGYILPPTLLSNMIQKRQKTLGLSFPDALDLMLICVEAGLSIEAAFGRVTEELGEGSPELAEELGLTTAELAFLGDRRTAYDNLSDRTGMASVKSLCTSLLQAEKYGTSVSTALRVIAQENRDARMAAAEKKAASLPAQLTVPMIIFFLPVLFLVIAGPAYIKVKMM
ncbi:MAG: type II secretion system F family protein [Alphaproteobacteria bacterium]|nr:type II secretion system F family protein [Alphaproteobacteria bacterium]